MSPDIYILIDRILFWIAVSVVSLDAYFIIFHRGVPNIRTAPAIRHRMIALLREDREARGKAGAYTIVDVGSGNGLLTRDLARALPDAKVVGIEIAGQSIAWANMLKKRAGLANLEYRQMNFLDFNFAEADGVVMFLIPAVLTLLGKKLNAEARPGTLIISNKFRLGDGWQPIDELRIKTWYFNQGKLFVYRKS